MYLKAMVDLPNWLSFKEGEGVGFVSVFPFVCISVPFVLIVCTLVCPFARHF